MKTTRFTSLLAYLFCLFTSAELCSGEISIDGVEDRQVYGDRVSFKVNSEAGFDYTALLNDEAIALDVTIEVTEPEYYELYVHRREEISGTEQSELIRFIVQATQRGRSEWGLSPWTPYPPIESASSEFSGAALKIITPSGYPKGFDIPVIARVEDDLGTRLGVFGIVMDDGFPEHRLKLLRGVGSMFLPAAAEHGLISFTAEIQSLETPKQIAIEADTTWQAVSEDITTSQDWGENARIHIRGVDGNLLTIASGATLTIGSASVVMIDPDISIAVDGGIIVNGTADRPVIFTAQDRSSAWGGFLFESSTSEGQFAGAILTGSGADSKWFSNNPGHGTSHRKDQCLFYLAEGANVTLTECYMVDNHGQIAHGENAYLTMVGCLVQKCTTVGQFNGGEAVFKDCALIEFPSATDPYFDGDNDAIYLTRGAHSFTDCLIGWALDDGIDAGGNTEGSVEVNDCWFESCYHEAMAWSGDDKIAKVINTVILNCGQGIECGYDAPDVNAVNCLATSNLVGARFGDNYDWTYNGFLTVSNSLLLFNARDVWGRNWDDWMVRLLQMDIQNNYLSSPNANYPNNQIWDPVNDPNCFDRLEPFLPTVAETVGIGLATSDSLFDISEIPRSMPVRLSTFTTSEVSVDYSIITENGVFKSGSLRFVQGETLKHIQLEVSQADDVEKLCVMLSDPVNAEMTGNRKISYISPNDPLIREGDQWRYFKGIKEPAAGWNLLSFDDVNDPNWLVGASGIGYEANTGYESCIATELSDMKGKYVSVYARRLFFTENPSQLGSLTLTMDWDDGYIAYINGIPVDSKNPPNPPAYDEPATGSHEADSCSGAQAEQIDLSNYITDLVAGFNVLAFQVHNRTISNSDFIFIPALSGVLSSLPGDFEGDGNVDFADFALFTQAWSADNGQGLCGSICDISSPADGFVNMRDLQVFVENWLAGN